MSGHAPGHGHGSGQSVSWEEARRIARAAGALLPAPQSERLPLGEAIGRRLSQPVRAPMPLPHYDSSAMDGFAVRGPGPWTLIEDAESGDLHRRRIRLETGHAAPVLTGSLLPEGTEGILRTEHSARTADGHLAAAEGHAAPFGKDMRRAGSELPEGSELAPAGTLLTARRIAQLSAAGGDSVDVQERPLLSLAVTGNEVIASGLPGLGEVRDAFSTSVPALAEELGCRLAERVRLPDDEHAVRAWIRDAPGQILVMTGGTGMSSHDMVRRALEDLCTDVPLRSVDMRPGHPTMLGVLPEGRLVLGLPGNPFAAHAALCSFLPPILAGLRHEELVPLPLVRTASAVSPLDRAVTRLIPASWEADGPLLERPAHPLRRSGSGMLAGLADADVLLAVPPEGAEAGALLPALVLDGVRVS